VPQSIVAGTNAKGIPCFEWALKLAVFYYLWFYT
jgi:hypothetical protein